MVIFLACYANYIGNLMKRRHDVKRTLKFCILLFS